jgi:hypothetical protein
MALPFSSEVEPRRICIPIPKVQNENNDFDLTCSIQAPPAAPIYELLDGGRSVSLSILQHRIDPSDSRIAPALCATRYNPWR